LSLSACRDNRGKAPARRAGYQQYLAANDLDAVVYPTTPLPALEIGQEPFIEFGGEELSVFDLYASNAHLAPLMGAPAVTVPFGQQTSQVPAGGMDIMGAPSEDRRTLAVAQAISQILPRIRAPRELQPRPFQF